MRPHDTPAALGQQLRTDEHYECAACGFALWRPLWGFEHTVLGLYDDVRFPGRCLLAVRDHATRFEALDPELASALMLDAAVVGRVVRAAVGADRMNFAVLGNTEPHVHVHIIPRVLATDPVPDRPPWEHPEKPGPLAADVRERIEADLAVLLRKPPDPSEVSGE